MSTLKPWAEGPFELIAHAEMHRLAGDDFDRRIALIGYDNAIEVAITTYLSLSPLQRQSRSYKKEDVDAWLLNYHTKIDFFLSEIARRSGNEEYDKATVAWYHDLRNDQYHGGRTAVPQAKELEGIRQVALWVFGTLFDVSDVAKEIADHMASTDDHPKRSIKHDKLIDRQFGIVEVAERIYYTSEVLHGVDPFAYGDVAAGLEQSDSSGDETEDQEGVAE